MANRYQFRQDDWSYGMSQDDNGGAGSVFYAYGVNLRKDKKSFKIGPKKSTTSSTTTYEDSLVAGIVTSNVSQYWFSDAGYVYQYDLSEDYKVQATPRAIRNAFEVTQEDGSEFGVIICDTKIHRWPVASGIKTASTIIPDADKIFTTPANWSKTGGWSVTGGDAINGGSAGDLSFTTSSAATTKYRFKVVITAITGTITVKIGGVTLGTATTVGEHNFYVTTGGAPAEIFLIQTTDATTATIDRVDVYVTNVEESVVTYAATGNDQGHRPVYILGNRVFFGAGSDVKTLSCASGGWVLDTEKLEIGRSQEVTGITRIGDLFYVYANDGYSGYQYLWDGVSTEAERIIKWQDLPIRNVANFGNYDIVVASKSFPTVGRSYIYKVSGYSRQLIRQSGYAASPFTEDRFMTDSAYTNAIESVGDVCVIPANASEHGSSGIYGVGKFHPSYPECVSRDFVGITGAITATYFDEEGNNLYVASYNGTTKYVTGFVRPYSDYRFDTSGYVETNPILGQFGEAQEKEAVKYRIGYYIPATTSSIKVYYRKDGETSYTLHKTITVAAASYGSETFQLGDKFNRIQFKIELLSSDDTLSPEVSDFTLEYTPTNNSLGL
jgi:hypothetical protein